jgi:hypothetical protein
MKKERICCWPSCVFMNYTANIKPPLLGTVVASWKKRKKKHFLGASYLRPRDFGSYSTPLPRFISSLSSFDCGFLVCIFISRSATHGCVMRPITRTGNNIFSARPPFIYTSRHSPRVTGSVYINCVCVVFPLIRPIARRECSAAYTIRIAELVPALPSINAWCS